MPKTNGAQCYEQILKPYKTEVRTMKPSDINVEHGYQLRYRVDPHYADELETTRKEGVDLPPVEVAQVGDQLRLIDGFHRRAGRRASGDKAFDVKVYLDVPDDVAFRAACRANMLHGLRLTNRDKRKLVETAEMKAGGKAKPKEIADLCGVTAQFVNKVRREQKNEKAIEGGVSAQRPKMSVEDRIAKADAQLLKCDLATFTEGDWVLLAGHVQRWADVCKNRASAEVSDETSNQQDESVDVESEVVTENVAEISAPTETVSDESDWPTSGWFLKIKNCTAKKVS